MSHVHRVLFLSDIHFGEHDETAWRCVVKFIEATIPAAVVIGGDICDFSAISAYTPSMSSPTEAIPDIRVAVTEINRVVNVCPVVLLPGNHDERWEKALFGNRASAFAGAKGLSFRDQLAAQGLDPRVRWAEEGVNRPGLFLGDRAVLLRHGHRQGRFSPQHVAAKLLEECPTVSTVVGHHHRAQMYCRTSLGETIVAIANPHLSKNQEYTGGNPNWQKGFTVLDFYGRSRLRDCKNFSAYIVLFDEHSRFVFDRKVWQP